MSNSGKLVTVDYFRTDEAKASFEAVRKSFGLPDGAELLYFPGELKVVGIKSRMPVDMFKPQTVPNQRDYGDENDCKRTCKEVRYEHLSNICAAMGIPLHEITHDWANIKIPPNKPFAFSKN